MDLKRTCLRALWVITAVFIVPMGIWRFCKAAPRFAETAARSAGLAMGDYDAFVFKADNSSEISAEAAFEPGISIKRTVWDIDMAPEEEEIAVSSSEIPVPQPTEEVLNAIPYPESLESRDGVIEKSHYGRYDSEQYFDLENGGQVRNCTSISNGELYSESLKDIEFEIDPDSSEPQVLIYHTHATESFEPYERDWYDSSFSCKTTDPDKSIIAVGDAICRQLDQAGIAYIHDTLVHDYPSYNGSYQSSRATVEEILAEYPSIKIVLDVHRDAIEREDGTRIAPVAEVDGKEAAQIMIISCCDDGTGNIPRCLQNFRFASLLQSGLESRFPGFTRPVLFDYRFYNQDLSVGSLLIEVGSHGNSLDQAVYSGELIGRALAEMFG